MLRGYLSLVCVRCCKKLSATMIGTSLQVDKQLASNQGSCCLLMLNVPYNELLIEEVGSLFQTRNPG